MKKSGMSRKPSMAIRRMMNWPDCRRDLSRNVLLSSRFICAPIPDTLLIEAHDRPEASLGVLGTNAGLVEKIEKAEPDGAPPILLQCALGVLQ
jgi:hypothetical protein